jgi:hypothetical protein
MKENDEKIGQEKFENESDFLVSQILNASDREVLDNVRKVYGDENKLADETKEIFRRGLTAHQVERAFLKKTPGYVISPKRSTLSRVSGVLTGLAHLTEHVPLFTRRQIGLVLALATVCVAIITFVGETFLNFPSKVARNLFAGHPCYEDAANAPPDEMVHAYRVCAEQGDALAQYRVGQLYASGIAGRDKDDREAAQWYKRAAAQGYSYAQVALGRFYENGRGGLPKDDREAARLYSLAAAQGNPFAQMALASFYEHGRGGLPTDKIYAETLRKTASDALAVAMVPGPEK